MLFSKSKQANQRINLTWIVVFRLSIFLLGHVDVIHLVTLGDVGGKPVRQFRVLQRLVALRNGLGEHLSDII